MKLFGEDKKIKYSLTFASCGRFAPVVELVDTQDLKSCRHCDGAGSIPAGGTLDQY